MVLRVLSAILIITVSVHGITADNCASSPCINGGTCTDEGHTYRCTCPSGYRGPKCQLEPDSCVTHTCIHGDCVSVSSSQYTCNCTAGWTGVNCDTDINECTGVTCQNGGTCVNRLNGYKCTCAQGFAGVHCESPSENLASYNVSITMSDMSRNGYEWYANDGYRTNDFTSGCPGPKCCSRTGASLYPWWEITLDQTYPIRHIKIWNRLDNNNGAKLRYLTVTVNGEFCTYRHRSNMDTDIVDMYCPEGMAGNVIKLAKDNHKTLHLCELEIYGYIGTQNL